MRARGARLARAKSEVRERRWLLELDENLLDSNIGSAEVTEVPLDPFAWVNDDVFRIHSDVDLPTAHLDVDADGNHARHELGHIFGPD